MNRKMGLLHRGPIFNLRGTISPAHFELLVDRVFSRFVFLADKALPAVIMTLRAVVDLLSMRDMAGFAGKLTVMAVVRVPGKEVCGLSDKILADVALQTDIVIVG